VDQHSCLTMTDFSKITAVTEGFASSSPLIDGWAWSTDPPTHGDGWFAVLLSYEEDGTSTHAMVFAGGRARTFTAGTLIAHAGPFPDQATAEEWGYDHDPDDIESGPSYLVGEKPSEVPRYIFGSSLKEIKWRPF